MAVHGSRRHGGGWLRVWARGWTAGTRRFRARLLAASLAATMLLGGCASSTPPTKVSQVVVAPSAQLLTSTGKSVSLAARVLDANGNEMADVSVTWSSSAPDVVSVTQDGTATAHTDVGSALVIATAGGVDSFPVSVVVAEPVSGAVLLTDEQVLEGPTDVVGTSDPIQQHLLLAGDLDLPAGTVIIGSGEAAIGGAVVSSAPSAGGLEVVYSPLPISDLFERLSIDEDVALSAAPVVPVADVDGSVTVRSLGEGVTTIQSVVETPDDNLLGIKCQGESGSFVTITGLSTSVDNDLTYHLHLSDGVGDPRPTELYVDGSITQKFSSGLSVKSGYSGSYTCKKVVANIPIPIGGVVAIVARPVIPVGVGGSVSGSVQTAGVTINVETSAGVKLKAGFTGDESGAVTLLHDVDPTFDPPSVKFDVVTPAGFRIGASGFVGLMSGVNLDVIGFDPFSLIKVQVGPQQSFDLASAEAQAASKAYASSYDLSIVASAGIGDSIDALYKWLLGKNVSVQPFQFQWSHAISKSPSGTFTASTTDPVPGDEVHLHVTLGTDHLTYLGHYNVSKILIYRSTGEDDPTVWRTIELSASNQSDFDTVWDTSGEVPGAYRFQAFVVDDILAKVIAVPLEVAADSTVVVSLGGVCTAAVPAAVVGVGAAGIGTAGACSGTSTWDYDQSDDVNGVAVQVHTTGSNLTWKQDESNPLYFRLTGATVTWTDVTDYTGSDCSITSSGSGLRVTNTDADAGTYVRGIVMLQPDGSYWGSGYVYVLDAADDGCWGGTKDENVPLFMTGDGVNTLIDDGSGGSYLTGAHHGDPAPDQIGVLDTSWSFHFEGVQAP